MGPTRDPVRASKISTEPRFSLVEPFFVTFREFLAHSVDVPHIYCISSKYPNPEREPGLWLRNSRPIIIITVIVKHSCSDFHCIKTKGLLDEACRGRWYCSHILHIFCQISADSVKFLHMLSTFGTSCQLPTYSVHFPQISEPRTGCWVYPSRSMVRRILFISCHSRKPR